MFCRLFLLLSLAASPAAAAELAFVVNSNDASVSVLDVRTHQEVRRIPLLREPHHFALTPDGKSLLVGDVGANVLFFLDPRTGAVQRQATISDPYQITFSPDGRYLTVAALARNQIDIYAAGSLALLHRIPAYGMPSHINYSPDSSTVFVSLQQSDSLIAIDTATGRVKWKQPVGKTPAGVLYLNGHVLVGIMGEDHVAVVDAQTGQVVRTVLTGRGAHVLFLTHDGRTLYVSNRVDGTLSVLDPATLTVQRTLRVPHGPDDIDFAPDGKIWASLRWGQAVAVIDPATGSEETIPVGRSPHGIWLNTHDHLDLAKLSVE